MTTPLSSPRPETPPGETVPTGPAAVAVEAVPSGPPEPPAELLEAARLAPDHWISAIDPGWTDEGPPPAFAVAGRWRSGFTGEIEEWEENEEYRPSPRALGWPEPTDALDAALQGAVTGYGPPEEVARALAGAELLVLTLSDGSPVTAMAADGTPVVPVFSAPAHLDLVGGFASARRTAPELLRDLPPGHRLYVNPAGPADAVLSPEVLAEATDTTDPTDPTDVTEADVPETDVPDAKDATDTTDVTDAAPAEGVPDDRPTP
ncbi:type VII secretion system-associated protein [Streptomyces sp. B3I8]|uniref:type VII secretion system-associated protein n=1 Tax=Streptomyces sp. B3I8 TaxID=3042303 RepID=UPI0027838394|nr:type VII secretion system-associated protein [Streptomyces sp. B3I8]MDQ0791046.1 hypothetical protein [Streptomyces sp. B3I8]